MEAKLGGGGAAMWREGGDGDGQVGEADDFMEVEGVIEAAK